MNLQRAYILLAVFYSALIVVGLIALTLGAGSLVSIAQLLVGAVAVLGLWGYILGKGFMNSHSWRPFTALLAIGVVLQLLAVFTMPVTNADITWLLSGAIFSAMLLAILYRYGDRDQELWASDEEIEEGAHLGQLLESQPELVVEKQEADRQAKVRMVKTGDRYRASVTRRYGEQEESFEKSFKRPSTLAYFIQTFTCITLQDLRAQHGNDKAPAA
ncbi:hypothetical protein KG088_07200 [Halomonas sp. TRM85114]|uniref:hypothetical protein n=1 Tax=Halomonas jincaotanensis TaxID=2810616 RepID=UPI001BD285DA|nr:hypothetical protein [Halomonas jincaotanensis]MBS9403410.1 hypothetical protein [Halomonas jincaotanensis]